MKKFKYLVIALIAVLFTSGCGSSEQKLTCSTTEELMDGVSMVGTVSMKFKDEKINFVEMKMDVKATNEDLKDAWDEFVGFMGNSYSESDSADGIKISINNNKNKYTYTIDIQADLAKASKNDLKKYDLDDYTEYEGSLKEIKKELESEGFTCK